MADRLNRHGAAACGRADTPNAAVIGTAGSRRRLGFGSPGVRVQLGDPPIPPLQLRPQPLQDAIHLVHPVAAQDHGETETVQVGGSQRMLGKLRAGHRGRVVVESATPAHRKRGGDEHDHRANHDEDDVHNADRAT